MRSDGMETSAFSRLLDEYRCTMMQRCPAYRLDCVMEETLCDILTNWNYGFGIAFQECKMELYKDGLARCRKSFEYNQALAEKILEGNIHFDRPEMALQENFMVDTGMGEEARDACQRVKLAAKLEGESLEGFMELYEQIVIDKVDFEQMVCCIAGIQTVNGDKKVYDWVRELMEPDKRFCCGWM